MTGLPYSFDLLYDIKTLRQLRIEYNAARAKVNSIEAMSREFGISLECSHEQVESYGNGEDCWRECLDCGCEVP